MENKEKENLSHATDDLPQAKEWNWETKRKTNLQRSDTGKGTEKRNNNKSQNNHTVSAVATIAAATHTGQ